MIRKLLDRRVPQFVLLYLAGAWGFLEFLDWAVTRYLLSPALIDFALAVLLLLLPRVFVIAWRHGAPGDDDWKRIDAAAIGMNALVAAVILFAAFRDAELGAATTVKLVEDATGNTVERVVPKAGFRRSVLVYDFENETGAEELDWLEFGLPLSLEMDLAQDLFVTISGIDDPSVREYLAERGIQPAGDVPLPLKRDAAQIRGMEHFLAGSIRGGGDSIRVETRLYRTATGRLVSSHEYGMSDPRSWADPVSVDLREDLGIPDGQIQQSVDLPAAELLTDSPEAFRLIALAQRHLFRDNDPAEARRLAERALAIDSTAALAHLAVASAALSSGDQAGAEAAVNQAIRYAYRLPERMRLLLQLENQYLFEGDLEAAVRTGQYGTEVYPQDIRARRMLANLYAATGDTEGLIRELRALLAIDSTNLAAMRRLAGVLTAQGAYDSALAWADRLLELAETFYYYRGQFRRVEQAYRSRLTLLAENEPILTILAEIDNSEFLRFAAEAGRGAEALAQIDSLRALVQEPWSHRLDYAALRNHLAMGNLDEARSALAGFESWIDFAGSSDARRARVARAKGEIATFEDGNCRRALALYEEAVDLQSDGGFPRVRRLACLTELERWREAEADAKWLLERVPGRPTWRLALARHEAARGRTAEALEHLDFALSMWAEASPDYRPAQEARALRERLRE